MIITSPANPRIKHIRKLNERKYRELHGEYYIEGLHIVAEAIEQGADLVTVITSPELLTSEFGQSLIRQTNERGVDVLEVSPEVFARLSDKDGPQGIAAVGQQRIFNISAVKTGKDNVWVALDKIQDPGNLGTIVRTCDATGCAGVILLDNCTDPYDPTALRASMGAIYNIKLVKTSFSEFSVWQRDLNIPVVGTSDRADIYYRDAVYPSAMVVLMGSEKLGLTPDHLKLCSQVVSIPMLGKSDSLNLAVATGVILYEYVHQVRMQRDLRGK